MLEAGTTDNNESSAPLNVEEFECGVSVEGTDKQEWSFTLYDFDGKGKITKEDLAGLLKSLYDAVGSSIKLPEKGTKTLKLRLTVNPDNTKIQCEPVLVSNSAPTSPTDPSKTTSPRDSGLSPTLEDSELKERLFMNKVSHSCSKSRHKDKNLRDSMKPTNLYCTDKLDMLQLTKDLTNDLSAMHLGDLSGDLSGMPRLSSIEQKQLAELVQKNMERHRQRQQQLRRHNSEHTSNHPCGREGKKVRNTHHKECADRRNYYLDLAGIENNGSSKLHNVSAPAAMMDQCWPEHAHTPHKREKHKTPHTCSKVRSKSYAHAHASRTAGECGASHPHHSNSRSKSHDVRQRLEKSSEHCVEDSVEQNVTNVTNNNEKEDADNKDTVLGSPKPQPKSASTPKPHRHRGVSLPAHLPESVSPHHHRRHRNRERNKHLAMQNVAEWIEREPFVNCDGEHVIIQRHEHHHVHEHHHHHHYHHYHET
eukprot:GHVU01028135.1.p1 GENE.GHVU01028135.1~~GHVU01028135.1.p1  ORF type:complete len:522 (+),score=32.86 GHVU01028135.1:133-1566(+)